MNPLPNTPWHAEALVLHALLRASLRILGPCAMACSLLALLCLLGGMTTPGVASAGWLAVLLAGFCERYLALRLALDETLFRQLGTQQLADLPALDQALAQLGLRAAAAVPRDWPSRRQGAKRLWQGYVLLVVLQVCAVIVIVFFQVV